MFSSHSGEANITLSVDTLLAAKFLFGKSLLNKTTLNQLLLWTLPAPVVIKVYDGGPYWTIS